VHQCTIYTLALQLIYDLDDRLVQLLRCLQLPGNELSPTWFMPYSLLFPAIAHVLSMLLLPLLPLLLHMGATAIARLALVAKNAIYTYAIHHATLPVEIMAQYLPLAHASLHECRHSVLVDLLHQICTQNLPPPLSTTILHLRDNDRIANLAILAAASQLLYETS
jgi:hypothetical protein